MPEEGPCSDFVGEYFIYYKEGEQALPSVPDKDCIIFRVTAQGQEE